jgi:hypothetical protein
MSSKSNFLALSLRQIVYYGLHGTLPNLPGVIA